MTFVISVMFTSAQCPSNQSNVTFVINSSAANEVVMINNPMGYTVLY
ncbi:uncharacterized protein METZ01_LOCUS320003, partial [marine metagenome]